MSNCQYILYFIQSCSYMTEFEEITLGDSDEEEGFKFDEFEEVVIPEDENPDGTKKCMCTCHQNPNAKNFHMRNIHCTNCCLKVMSLICFVLFYQSVIFSKKIIKEIMSFSQARFNLWFL